MGRGDEPIPSSAVRDDLFRSLFRWPSLQGLWQGLQKRQRELLVHGLNLSGAAALVAALRTSMDRPMLLLTAEEEEGEIWADLLNRWAQEEVALLWRPRLLLSAGQGSVDPRQGEQVRALARYHLVEKKPVVVAPVAALTQPLLPPDTWRDGWVRGEMGDEIPLDRLADRLVAAGYEPSDLADRPGLFARRGGILDIFPVGAEAPYRVEFFGDTVESVRLFDPETQRSREEVWSFEVPPASLEPREERAFLPDHLGPDLLLLVWDPLRVEERAQKQGEMAGAEGIKVEDLRRRGSLAQILYLTSLPRPPRGAQVEGFWALETQTVPPFLGQEELLKEELSRWQKGKWRVLLCAPDGERAVHWQERLQAMGLDVLRVEGWTGGPPLPPPGEIWVVQHPVPQGVVWPSLRTVILGQEDLGARRSPKRVSLAREGSSITSADQLSVGDYVVHAHHGIGQYMGILTLDIQGAERDYLVLRYEGQDRLYVPMDQIHLIDRYVGEESPRVHRLGGAEWRRVKARAKEEVREMALELLHLYAAREATPGHAFRGDSELLQACLARFPYEDTPDQRKAWEEVRADMARPRPMDRLICGDVGFGKTEIAIRAACLAVGDGYQVALLVPTTILAEQHFMTFTQRFAGLPVEIRLLNRFRTPQEIADTLKGLRTGQVDIVIGTHRLLQDDVAFHNLGLLIIDEEQRFGVAHKERLKKLRHSVDVLTLTATPIPRTLHMALSGLRDMSLIETPPENRYPVETYVVEHSDRLVQEAIRRELARGGQVFYLHNRVQTMPRVYQYLRRLVPEARIGMAHGQMADRELEEAMVDFLHRRYDVLLCTSIIESGLDLPNVNTLIVEDADTMGLAQLHQIRGRVGRSDRIAFAYFTYRPQKILTEAAEKRLKALEDFAYLGAGFRVAMRDLEIRGAGNILGAQQHGTLLQIGYQSYVRLLEEAVREVRGERWVPEMRTAIELPVPAYLPESYIPSARAKVDIYRRLQGATRFEELEDLRQELQDRFGELPPVVEDLFALERLRLYGTRLHLLSIGQEGRQVRLQFSAYLEGVLPEVLTGLSSWGRQVTLRGRPRPFLYFTPKDGEPLLPQVEALLKDLLQVPALLQRKKELMEA
ncbi:MAG: transcription-repair coupling factor [Clostridiales bacterium]|nr:transcription-repair coupling factor [Clostridiales bacterium]